MQQSSLIVLADSLSDCMTISMDHFQVNWARFCVIDNDFLLLFAFLNKTFKFLVSSLH